MVELTLAKKVERIVAAVVAYDEMSVPVIPADVVGMAREVHVALNSLAAPGPSLEERVAALERRAEAEDDYRREQAERA